MNNLSLPPVPLQQSQYIVAHIDFLGSKSKMKSAEERDDFLQNLHRIYHGIIKVINISQEHRDTKLEIRVFSDNILIAKKVEFGRPIFDEWQYISRIASIFQATALRYELLVRGAISIGNFYIDDVFVYGEALAKAYEMENHRAIYPRIIVDNSFFDRTLFTGEIRTIKDNTFFKDIDGEWCINFVDTAIPDSNQNPNFLLKIRTAISKMYAENKDNLRVRPKYYWLINKFNELVKKAGYDQYVIPMTIFDTPDTVKVLLKRGKE